ncbi:MAG TPA: class I SAM-dependent methyltransferase [Cyclobacteriaceae bacterium]|nr:class I SAM-dependent methyltransferase [Cyclobacteriaceae bacterium]
MNAKEHYENHLGGFYGWMSGDFLTKQTEQEFFFIRNGIEPGQTATAIDLGCGHGLQSVSLAKRGFVVEAVDFNDQLIEEIMKNKGDLTIRIHQQDLIKFLNDFDGKADIITCMGDTITHLSDRQLIVTLIKTSAEKLIHGGKLVIAFRDLTQELADEKRFFLVQSDSERIHSCFLEYFPGYVKVFDILNTLERGKWIQKASWYSKLRIDELYLRAILNQHSFAVINSEVINGLIYVIAQKK